MCEEKEETLCDICVNKEECSSHFMMCPFFEPKDRNTSSLDNS